MRSTKLPKLVAELNELVEDERRRREAFLDWVQPGVKAEFINGSIVMHSPTKFVHSDVRMNLSRATSLHAMRRAIGTVLDEKAMVHLERNDYMPDVCFWRTEVAETFESEQELFPAPDFVAEVLSPTTEKIDRGEKFADYADAGVREYWIIDAELRVVEQYALENGAFKLVATARDGVIESHAIEGFSIPHSAIFDQRANVDYVARLIA